MALPKLNVPVYEAVLPSTEKVIKYRPFLVKEEKILLTALEADETKALSAAVKQIVNNCVQGELNVDDLPTFDIEYLFLRLRAKSVGEKVTVGLRPWGCPKNEGKLCENSTQVEINLEEVKVNKDKASSPLSCAVNNNFSSLTKNGLYFITFSVDGKIASYTGTFSLGNAIMGSFHDG